MKDAEQEYRNGRELQRAIADEAMKAGLSPHDTAFFLIQMLAMMVVSGSVSASKEQVIDMFEKCVTSIEKGKP